MKPFLLLAPILLWSLGAIGQEISRSVISTGGNQQTDPITNLQLSWTIGEIGTEFLSNQNTIQLGFQQGDIDVIVNTKSKALPAPAWQAYPNPVDFELQIKSPFPGRWYYFLRDPLGRIILKGQSDQSLYQLDLPVVTDGLYLLSIQQENGRVATKNLFIQQHN